MLEKMLSPEARLAVINFNDILGELGDYFDSLKNLPILSYERLLIPEDRNTYCLVFNGSWEKNNKEGKLAVKFWSIKSGALYQMKIELEDFKQKGEITAALVDAHFTLINQGQYYSQDKPIIDLDLMG